MFKKVSNPSKHQTISLQQISRIYYLQPKILESDFTAIETYNVSLDEKNVNDFVTISMILILLISARY